MEKAGALTVTLDEFTPPVQEATRSAFIIADAVVPYCPETEHRLECIGYRTNPRKNHLEEQSIKEYVFRCEKCRKLAVIPQPGDKGNKKL